MTTIKNGKFVDFIGKLKYWSNLTNDNMHTEARMDIALFFELDDEANYFFQFILKDSLTMAEYTERNERTDKMLTNIGDTYGDYIENVIRRTL